MLLYCEDTLLLVYFWAECEVFNQGKIYTLDFKESVGFDSIIYLSIHQSSIHYY